MAIKFHPAKKTNKHTGKLYLLVFRQELNPPSDEPEGATNYYLDHLPSEAELESIREPGDIYVGAIELR